MAGLDGQASLLVVFKGRYPPVKILRALASPKFNSSAVLSQTFCPVAKGHSDLKRGLPNHRKNPAALNWDMNMSDCRRRSELTADVQRVLGELGDLMHRQRDAVGIAAENTVLALDKQIELKFGEKERAMGALEFHRREHSC